MLRSSFTNFSFTTPSDKFLDGRTFLYCLPIVRHIMRIATAILTIKSNSSSEAVQVPTNYEIKREWKDIAKWIAGSFVADIFAIPFIPYFGVISAITALFALVATCYQRKDDFRTMTPSRAWDLLSATPPSATI